MRRRLGRLAVGMTVAVGAAGLAAVAQRGDAETITGVVTSSAGPEAGVWVIAETDDLPTKFRKIVVTGDDGRFLLPELPEVSYLVWVRGYGLIDSAPVTAAPGQDLRLTAVAAARTPAGSRGRLSGRLLAVADRAAGGERVSRAPGRTATASARNSGRATSTSTT